MLVESVDTVQRFPVMPPVVLGGGFIKVNFHGKKQRQLPDFKFYTAIASVAAEGRALRPETVVGAMHRMKAQLGPTVLPCGQLGRLADPLHDAAGSVSGPGAAREAGEAEVVEFTEDWARGLESTGGMEGCSA